ncbi:hypothetical protein SCTVLC_1168 [Serratia symbiotica SCt-VLC]|uniref:Uncharacterized protein n=1 Tax=Serratia symbiotica SCt-VLC TaxID=1347341 RepID=A0A068RBI1_9GAMM|nr:hypothetical protein SCTVLC_1168 [Serratia symbiotica SCt-VLC]
MKNLNISWVGICPLCDNDILKVETEDGSDSWLYEGEKITCPQCGSTGAVEVDEDHAYAVWDNDWSNSDGQ